MLQCRPLPPVVLPFVQRSQAAATTSSRTKSGHSIAPRSNPSPKIGPPSSPLSFPSINSKKFWRNRLGFELYTFRRTRGNPIFPPAFSRAPASRTRSARIRSDSVFATRRPPVSPAPTTPTSSSPRRRTNADKVGAAATSPCVPEPPKAIKLLPIP